MGYRIEWTAEAQKDLKKLDRSTMLRILRDLGEIDLSDNPEIGEPLSGLFQIETPAGTIKSKVWKLKIGPRRDYRLFYLIDKRNKVVYVLKISHRKKAYRRTKFRI